MPALSDVCIHPVIDQSLQYLQFTAVSISIQSIFISHFLLNLRNIYLCPMEENSPSVGTSAYASFVGNLGAPLRVPTYDQDLDEDEDVAYVTTDPLLVGLNLAKNEADNKNSELAVGLDDSSVANLKTCDA